MNRKCLKERKAVELSKNQKRESIYFVLLAFLSVKPAIDLCMLADALPLSFTASPRNIFLITYWRNISYPEDNK